MLRILSSHSIVFGTRSPANIRYLMSSDMSQSQDLTALQREHAALQKSSRRLQIEHNRLREDHRATSRKAELKLDMVREEAADHERRLGEPKRI